MATKEDQKKDWAEMSDGDEPETEVKEEDKAKITVKKKKVPAAQKGFKNDRGDYVVTSINIPDMRQGVKKDEDGQPLDDSDSDSVYDDEDDAKEEAKEAQAAKVNNEGKYRVFL
jgi:hypothetical protein